MGWLLRGSIGYTGTMRLTGTRHWLMVLALLVLALGIGCQESPALTAARARTPTAAEGGTLVEGNAPGIPPLTGAIHSTPSGLRYIEEGVGSGDVRAGQTVNVHYTGWLTNGTKFDSSRDRGQPFAFPLGAGRVIRGWDEGVATMKIGGKRRLIIPPELGYGSQGAGNLIPPDATLIFDVELLSAN